MTVWRWLAPGIAALAATGFWWFAPAGFLASAAPPTIAPARIDPVLAARQVLQDQDFWWKRIEQRKMPATGIQGFFEAVLEFLAELGKTILEFLRSLWSMLSLIGGDWSGSSQLVWLIAAIVLAWAIWKIYPALVRWIGGIRAEPGAPKGPAAAWQTLAEPATLFGEAGDAFAARKYAEAIRLALLALIARLEKQGLLRYDTTRTNREYQRELRHTSDLAASFGQLARIYERVWYGRMPAGRDEAERAIGLCRALLGKEDLAPE